LIAKETTDQQWHVESEISESKKREEKAEAGN
jgi:hypothetical protein